MTKDDKPHRGMLRMHLGIASRCLMSDLDKSQDVLCMLCVTNPFSWNVFGFLFLASVVGFFLFPKL